MSEERAFLLRSLCDLEAERAAGDLSDDDYRRLRDSYTVRAAAALRAGEAPAGEPPAGEAPAGEPPAGEAPSVGATEPSVAALEPRPVRSKRVQALLALAGVAICAGLAGYTVANASGERSATQEATGTLPQGSVDRITTAQALVRKGKILEAVRVYDSLLADDPANPVALAERGWLLSRVDPSLLDAGLASIDRAIAADPGYPEAHFFRGMILWRAKGDPAAGAREFQLALDAGPPPDLARELERLRDQAQAEAPAP